jgi:hypothetical protein
MGNCSLTFSSQRFENLTPDVIVKLVWDSMCLALIFVIPPLGLFVLVLDTTMSVALSALVGFGLHFVLFMVSKQICSRLTSMLDV